MYKKNQFHLAMLAFRIQCKNLSFLSRATKERELQQTIFCIYRKFILQNSYQLKYGHH